MVRLQRVRVCACSLRSRLDFKEIWLGGERGEEVLAGGLYWGPSQAQEVWQKLQPSLARVARMEKLVGWWRPVQPLGIGGEG